MSFKMLSIAALLAILLLATASSLKPGDEFKNLKILPRDISAQKLDSIMHSYNKALQVQCDFCHVKTNPADTALNFAADGSMKESARRMIQLMMDINTKYFYYDSTIKPQYLNAVSCNTCHRGEPFPLGY